MEYKPTFKSFISSSLYGLSPAITAVIVMYFIADSAKLIMWVISGVMVIFSFFLFLQSFFGHLQKLFLDENHIYFSSPFRKVEMKWSDIVSAVLRERENAVSRTDHLLILNSSQDIIAFNTSTLSDKDEKDVLQMVNKKTNLVTQRDKSTI
jgi:hypothetical protein